MAVGWPQILLVVLLLVLLFGRGKISDLMGDVAKGIKSFKKGMADDVEEEASDKSVHTIEHEAKAATKSSKEESKAG
ncbi:MAG: twin-arginine translocase TatA/TatE family subunit [Hyphomicrobiaceae bacterium]|nr:twin-arginine translocase TatA/TatE family subunit [Hyphomicrobiaceae bacterium]